MTSQEFYTKCKQSPKFMKFLHRPSLNILRFQFMLCVETTENFEKLIVQVFSSKCPAIVTTAQAGVQAHLAAMKTITTRRPNVPEIRAVIQLRVRQPGVRRPGSVVRCATYPSSPKQSTRLI